MNVELDLEKVLRRVKSIEKYRERLTPMDGLPKALSGESVEVIQPPAIPRLIFPAVSVEFTILGKKINRTRNKNIILLRLDSFIKLKFVLNITATFALTPSYPETSSMYLLFSFSCSFRTSFIRVQASIIFV